MSCICFSPCASDGSRAFSTLYKATLGSMQRCRSFLAHAALPVRCSSRETHEACNLHDNGTACIGNLGVLRHRSANWIHGNRKNKRTRSASSKDVSSMEMSLAPGARRKPPANPGQVALRQALGVAVEVCTRPSGAEFHIKLAKGTRLWSIPATLGKKRHLEWPSFRSAPSPPQTKTGSLP